MEMACATKAAPEPESASVFLDGLGNYATLLAYELRLVSARATERAKRMPCATAHRREPRAISKGSTAVFALRGTVVPCAQSSAL